MNNQKQNNYGNNRGGYKNSNRNNSSNQGFKKYNSKGGDFKKKPNNKFKGNSKDKKQPKAIFYQKVLYMFGFVTEFKSDTEIPIVKIDGRTLQNTNCVHQMEIHLHQKDFSKEELDILISNSLLLIEIWKFEDKIKIVFILNNNKNIIKYFGFNIYDYERIPIIIKDIKDEKENVLQKTCIYTPNFENLYLKPYNETKIEFSDIENKQILRHLKGILKSKT